ncbi:MAG TPA: HEPN domain-containing protein [Ignavibacteria bacterium]|jgi:HEPN domain-containing protein
MDIEKQIDYWIDNAFKDMESADLLILNGKYLHGLFFCHLVVEKALKAHVVKFTKDHPPKSHNLPLLAKKADLSLSDDFMDLLGILMTYQLEGRYPEHTPVIPDKNTVYLYLNQTKTLMKWLKEKL